MNIAQFSRISKQELSQKHNQLVISKMKMDKFFSEFLEENELDHVTPDTPHWMTYKKKLVEYQCLSNQIKWAEYYMGRV